MGAGPPKFGTVSALEHDTVPSWTVCQCDLKLARPGCLAWVESASWRVMASADSLFYSRARGDSSSAKEGERGRNFSGSDQSEDVKTSAVSSEG